MNDMDILCYGGPMGISTDWANCIRMNSFLFSRLFCFIQIWTYECDVIIRLFSECFSLQIAHTPDDRASCVAVDHLDINCFWKVWDLCESAREVKMNFYKGKGIAEIICSAAVRGDRVAGTRSDPERNNAKNAFYLLFFSLPKPNPWTIQICLTASRPHAESDRREKKEFELLFSSAIANIPIIRETLGLAISAE